MCLSSQFSERTLVIIASPTSPYNWFLIENAVVECGRLCISLIRRAKDQLCGQLEQEFTHACCVSKFPSFSAAFIRRQYAARISSLHLTRLSGFGTPWKCIGSAR
jgi:hypothetical protein